MLSADIRTKTDALLTIDYTLSNDRSSELFVFDVLSWPTESGDQAADPHLAYVGPHDASTAVIGKYLGATPAGMKVESPEIPLLARLAPGERIVGRIAVRIPLARRLPYLSAPVSRQATGTVDRLIIRIGFLDSARFTNGMAFVEPASGRPPEDFVCDYGLGLESQEFAEVGIPAADGGIGTFFV